MKKILNVKDWLKKPHFISLIQTSIDGDMIQVQRINDGRTFRVPMRQVRADAHSTIGFSDMKSQLTYMIHRFEKDMIHVLMEARGSSNNALGYFYWPLNDFEQLKDNTNISNQFKEPKAGFYLQTNHIFHIFAV